MEQRQSYHLITSLYFAYVIFDYRDLRSFHRLYITALATFFCLVQARDGITEVHFLPFNPVDKRTAITYIDTEGKWHRVSKGAPEQVNSISFGALIDVVMSITYVDHIEFLARL